MGRSWKKKELRKTIQVRIATFIYDYQDNIQERSKNTRLTLGEV